MTTSSKKQIDISKTLASMVKDIDKDKKNELKQKSKDSIEKYDSKNSGGNPGLAVKSNPLAKEEAIIKKPIEPEEVISKQTNIVQPKQSEVETTTKEPLEDKSEKKRYRRKEIDWFLTTFEPKEVIATISVNQKYRDKIKLLATYTKSDINQISQNIIKDFFERYAEEVEECKIKGEIKL